MMHSIVYSYSIQDWCKRFFLTFVWLTWWLLIPSWSDGYTDRIVAVVNKEVITWSDLQHAIRDEFSRLKAKYQGQRIRTSL